MKCETIAQPIVVGIGANTGNRIAAQRQRSERPEARAVRLVVGNDAVVARNDRDVERHTRPWRRQPCPTLPDRGRLLIDELPEGRSSCEDRAGPDTCRLRPRSSCRVSHSANGRILSGSSLGSRRGRSCELSVHSWDTPRRTFSQRGTDCVRGRIVDPPPTWSAPIEHGRLIPSLKPNGSIVAEPVAGKHQCRKRGPPELVFSASSHSPAGRA